MSKKNVTINIDKLIDNIQITLCSKDDISDGINALKINDKVKAEVEKAFMEAFKNTVNQHL